MAYHMSISIAILLMKQNFLLQKKRPWSNHDVQL